mmetsp:Transcript_43807/g.93787  ORF Transcript_43807/g.93787 Transcript_43807/m.93787 type:complete len:248 (-) Transcript_43807:239-982(-)|eukprot:CAMPEP_0206469510 /NCGR_PEP_ID=MMETSP0324_2-20121206/30327_1 /ASSEMBLY_ACC=CAM_ASM_000836 /TAXON_ID=2866 /ORGANISM="Crypthecodinium cohnii, Strain Seligo" /LENGTH=247 /DNA_ID=CAMNT_0053943291 /DNA_START=225 /DNA_END=968 /DNA_ORIENTATION=-
MATDPYYIAKEEVEGAIRKAQDMHKEWNKLLYSENTARSQRFQQLHSSLVADIEQLDMDVQDLAATIAMVEENPSRFAISSGEIALRKAFVSGSEKAVRSMQDSVRGAAAQSKIDADKRSALLQKDGASGASSSQDRRAQGSRENDQFLARERQTQQQIVRQQDETLDQIAQSAQRLHGAASTISIELKEQQQMLKDLDNDIDKETEKLNFVMKRIGRLMQTGDSNQICLIIGLTVLMVVLIFFIIN